MLVPQDPGHNLDFIRRDQSDSDGSFTLNYALPGNYTVIAIENGWDLEWLKAETLNPYLREGTGVQVHSRETLNIKVKVQTTGAAE